MTLTSQSLLPALLAAYRRDHTLLPGSLVQLRCAAEAFSCWFGQVYGRPPAVADLTKPNLHDWMDWSVGPPVNWSPATANSKRTALVSLAGFAADAGLVAVPRKIKRFTEGNDPPGGWQLDEFDRLLWAASLESREWLPGRPAGLFWAAGLRMIWDSGARFEELWLAEVEHVNLTKRTWLVPARHRKGKKQGRLYALSEATCAAIAATFFADDPPRTRLWPFPCGRRQVWIHWDRILARAGLPANRRSKWHCVRRTAESHAAARRGKKWAAEAVGHSLAVAQRHYFVPEIVRTPSLSEALPVPSARPVLGVVG